MVRFRSSHPPNPSVWAYALLSSGFVAFAKGAATGHCICSSPNGKFRSVFFQKKNTSASDASIHVMSVMSVQLSACDFLLEYIFEFPFLDIFHLYGNPFLGNRLYFPLPFLSCHSLWMVVKGVAGGIRV